jgi:hypothetical protein
MMAELIVSKKEIWPQLKKSTGNLADLAEEPRCMWSTIAVIGKASGRAFDSLVRGFGCALGGGVRRLKVVAGI